MFTRRAAFEKILKPRSTHVQFSTQMHVKSKKKNKDHHDRKCPIFHLNSCEEQKKVITSADVLFFAEVQRGSIEKSRLRLDLRQESIGLFL